MYRLEGPSTQQIGPGTLKLPRATHRYDRAKQLSMARKGDRVSGTGGKHKQEVEEHFRSVDELPMEDCPSCLVDHSEASLSRSLLECLNSYNLIACISIKRLGI